MTAPRRNYDLAELRRLDVAHHLPAQQHYQLMEDLGGSRIITTAVDRCTSRTVTATSCSTVWQDCGA